VKYVFSIDILSIDAWFKEAIQIDGQIVQSWDDVLALSILWNDESLLDQCLKAGADPLAAIVLVLAKQNGQSNIYKKLLAAGNIQSRFNIHIMLRGFLTQKCAQK
jgi:hypothetical protein